MRKRGKNMKKIIFILGFISAISTLYAGTGPLDHFAITLSAGSVTAGVPVQVTIAAYDSVDNSDLKTDYTGPAILSADEGGDVLVVDPASATTLSKYTGAWNNDAVLGAGYWTGLIKIGLAAGTVTVRATDGASTGAAVKTVTKGPYTKLKLLVEGMIFAPGTVSGNTGSWVTQTATFPFACTVYAVDDWNNPVIPATAAIIQITAISGVLGSTTVNPNPYDISSGGSNTWTAYFTATLNPSQNNSAAYPVTAQDIMSSGKNNSFSVFFISPNSYYMTAEAPDSMIPITAGAPIWVTVTVSHFPPQNKVPGAPVTSLNGDNIQLDALDENGNALPASATQLSPVPTPQATTVNGIAYIEFTYTRTGIIRVKPVGLSRVMNNQDNPETYSNVITIRAGQPGSFTAAAGSKTLKRGDKTLISTTVWDTYGNPVTGTAVDFTATAFQGYLSAPSQNTDGSGFAAVDFTAPSLNASIMIAVHPRDSVSLSEQDITITAELTDKFENWPNPFMAGREVTKINYSLDEDSDIKMRLYSVFGKLVWTRDIKKGEIVNGEMHGVKGGNTVIWDGKSDRGYVVGAGVYILKVTITNSKGTKTQTRNIAVTK
jgi:hypothetical protein